MLKEIIVVEGKDDTAAVRRALEAETIETGGSAINKDILDRIRLAQERRGVIVLTDPDHAGERLRTIICAEIPNVQHAFIDREAANCNGSIGVEYASPETIRYALRHSLSVEQLPQSDLTWEDLMVAGLINHPQAANRRAEVGQRLHIGYANGKQFFKRCQMFRITRQEFHKAIEEWQSEQSGGKQ